MSNSKNVTPAADMFLPTLLDRLSQQGDKAVNRSAFRKTVLRDLNWLLNCTNIEGQLERCLEEQFEREEQKRRKEQLKGQVQEEEQPKRQRLTMQDFPEVRRSVLNFGIPPLAGEQFSEFDLDDVAAGIQRSLAYFEPRILPKSLRVSVIRDKETDVYRYNHARFRIEASYWFEPYPIDMVVRARWDMETGGVEIREER